MSATLVPIWKPDGKGNMLPYNEKGELLEKRITTSSAANARYETDEDGTVHIRGASTVEVWDFDGENQVPGSMRLVPVDDVYVEWVPVKGGKK